MSDDKDKTFVGADRLRAYSLLRELWNPGASSIPCHLVVVRGPSGSGRTTMLQNLYRHCALTQRHPRYWPTDLTTGVIRPEHSGLFPDPVMPEEGSQLDFFWWALSGRSDRCSAMEGTAQISIHLHGLAAAVQRADDLTRTRLRAAADATLLFGPFLPLHAAAKTFLTAVDVITSGSALENNIRDAFQTRTGLIDRARRAAAGRELTIGTRSAAIAAAEENARTLGAIAQIIPFAIVVDDAEFLDDVTVAMLKILLRQSSTRGLIILTINTDIFDRETSGLSEQSLNTWLEEEQQASRLTTITLEPMTTDELVEVAFQYLGISTADMFDSNVLSRVIGASNMQPGQLVHLLGIPAVQEAVKIGGNLPKDMRKLTKTAWFDEQFCLLSSDERRILAFMSLSGPTTPSAWLIDTPNKPIKINEILTSDEVDTALSTCWVKIDQQGMLRFTSNLHHGVARAAVTRELEINRQRQALTQLAAWVDAAHYNDSWVEIPPDVCENILITLTDQSLCDFELTSTPDWEAELIRLRLVTGRTGADNYTLSRIEERLRMGVPSAVLVVATAEALFDAGHVQRAIDVLQAELDRLVAKFGERSPATLPALANLAAAWARVFRDHVGSPKSKQYFGIALSLYSRLLDRHLGRGERATNQIFKTRHALAHLLADGYEYDAAISEGKILIIGFQSHPDYGPDHSETLKIRHCVATWIGESGDAEGARTSFSDLVRDRERLLGPDHPSVLDTRLESAEWTGRSGDVNGACILYSRLLPCLQMVLGADHPQSLKARNNSAEWTGQVGYPAKARDKFKELVIDNTRLLGPESSQTLVVRSNLAWWTKAAGDRRLGRELLENLLPDQVRILGEDHFHVLGTRSNIATCTGDDGDATAARDLFKDLLDDHIRVLGRNHPRSVGALQNLNFWEKRVNES